MRSEGLEKTVHKDEGARDRSDEVGGSTRSCASMSYAQLAALLEYRPFPLETSARQRGAEIVNLVALVGAAVFLAAAAIARPRRVSRRADELTRPK